MSNSVLVASGLSKRYGGIHALTDVGFEIAKGEVHGLCGENGAGKSTLVKILAGLVTPDSGEIILDGTPLRLGHLTDRSLISVVHQELAIIPDLSVLDNVVLGGADRGFVYRRDKYLVEVRR